MGYDLNKLPPDKQMRNVDYMKISVLIPHRNYFQNEDVQNLIHLQKYEVVSKTRDSNRTNLEVVPW